MLGLLAGEVLQQEWLSDSRSALQLGWTTLTVPKVIGVAAIAVVLVPSLFGVRPSLWLGYVLGALLVIPLVSLMVLPYLTGDFSLARLTWTVPAGFDGMKLALVWLFVMALSTYRLDAAATFGAEYDAPARDAPRALRAAGPVTVGMYLLIPLGIVGTMRPGEMAAGGPFAHFTSALRDIVGFSGTILTVFLLVSLLITMNTALLTSSRALHGMATQGLTIRQLGRLNRHGAPVAALCTGAAAGAIVVVAVDNPLGLFAAGNLGYVLAHVAALSGFLLLRRDEPERSRPLRLPAPWTAAAGLLLVLNLAILGAGIVWFGDTPWASGSTWLGVARELWIGLGLLAAGLGTHEYRRRIQDRGPAGVPDLALWDGAEPARS